jgi:hypothetical protein
MCLVGDLTPLPGRNQVSAWYGTRVASISIIVFELRATIARADSSCYFLGGRGRYATFLEDVVPFPLPSTGRLVAPGKPLY